MANVVRLRKYISSSILFFYIYLMFANNFSQSRNGNAIRNEMNQTRGKGKLHIILKSYPPLNPYPIWWGNNRWLPFGRRRRSRCSGKAGDSTPILLACSPGNWPGNLSNPRAENPGLHRQPEVGLGWCARTLEVRQTHLKKEIGMFSQYLNVQSHSENFIAHFPKSFAVLLKVKLFWLMFLYSCNYIGGITNFAMEGDHFKIGFPRMKEQQIVIEGYLRTTPQEVGEVPLKVTQARRYWLMDIILNLLKNTIYTYRNPWFPGWEKTPNFWCFEKFPFFSFTFLAIRAGIAQKYSLSKWVYSRVTLESHPCSLLRTFWRIQFV